MLLPVCVATGRGPDLCGSVLRERSDRFGNRSFGHSGSTDGFIESAVDHGRLCLLPLVASCGLPAARSWLVCRGLVRVCLSRSLVRVSVGRQASAGLGRPMARARTDAWVEPSLVDLLTLASVFPRALSCLIPLPHLLLCEAARASRTLR